ncbi:MAG: hypothetical protein VKP72_11745 [bacterium]|nr:hypothetical protein [bacterium]
MNERRRQVIKKIDGMPVVRRSPDPATGAHPGVPTSAPQPLLAASLEQGLRTLELREERIRALEKTTAEQASELATLRLDLASATSEVTRLEAENASLRATPAQDPMLTEKLHDLEKQVAEYQPVLEQRGRQVQDLEAKVRELEARLKKLHLDEGIDIGGGLRDL